MKYAISENSPAPRTDSSNYCIFPIIDLSLWLMINLELQKRKLSESEWAQTDLTSQNSANKVFQKKGTRMKIEETQDFTDKENKTTNLIKFSSLS